MERWKQCCTRRPRCLQEAALRQGKTAPRASLCPRLCPFTTLGLSAPRISRLRSVHQGKGAYNSSKACIMSGRVVPQGLNGPTGHLPSLSTACRQPKASAKHVLPLPPGADACPPTSSFYLTPNIGYYNLIATCQLCHTLFPASLR